MWHRVEKHLRPAPTLRLSAHVCQAGGGRTTHGLGPCRPCLPTPSSHHPQPRQVLPGSWGFIQVVLALSAPAWAPGNYCELKDAVPKPREQLRGPRLEPFLLPLDVLVLFLISLGPRFLFRATPSSRRQEPVYFNTWCGTWEAWHSPVTPHFYLLNTNPRISSSLQICY